MTFRYQDVVDAVFDALEHRKALVIDSLFPGASADYRQEWLDRTPFEFWAHLDSYNRAALANEALRVYRR